MQMANIIKLNRNNSLRLCLCLYPMCICVCVCAYRIQISYIYNIFILVCRPQRCKLLFRFIRIKLRHDQNTKKMCSLVVSWWKCPCLWMRQKKRRTRWVGTYDVYGKLEVQVENTEGINDESAERALHDKQKWSWIYIIIWTYDACQKQTIAGKTQIRQAV